MSSVGALAVFRSQRDELRIEALQLLAARLFDLDSDFVISGSYAIFLQVDSQFRVPNDLDVLTSHRAVVDGFGEWSKAVSSVTFPIRRTELYSGEMESAESLISIPNPRTGKPLDILPCQVVMADLSSFEVVNVNVGETNLALQPLEILIANKLHALWKIRTSSHVSTRVRDLFDLIWLSQIPKAHEQFSAAAIAARTMGPPRQPLGRYPQEWKAGWHQITRTTGLDLDIDAAWKLLTRLADE